MKTAIFGFSGSGKSSLFAALAGAEQATSGDRAMVKVPEPRLEPLIALFNPKKVTLSEIEFVDIPGGGGKGDGLGDRVLTAIRPAECLLAVLDGFSGLYDPKEQQAAIEADLLVADMAVVEKRLERMALDKRKNKDLVNPKEENALVQAMAVLEKEQPLREVPELAGLAELRSFSMLSAKPIVYIFNMGEEALGQKPKIPCPRGTGCVLVSAALEAELTTLENLEERALFMAELGLEQSARERVIKTAYSLLGLITFLTAGDKEVRAWAIRAGSSAPVAAGTIHSDIEKGFIRAEVLSFDDFQKAGDFKKAKDLGLYRLEGKTYIVQDGDIIEFRFNV